MVSWVPWGVMGKMGLRLLGCACGCLAVYWLRVPVGKMHREAGVGESGSPETWKWGGAGVGGSGCQGCVSEGAGKEWVTQGGGRAWRETGRLSGVGNVSQVLGMEQSVVMMVLQHPKMTALFKPRKKGPLQPLLGSRILHPSSGVCSGRVHDFH